MFNLATRTRTKESLPSNVTSRLSPVAFAKSKRWACWRKAEHCPDTWEKYLAVRLVKKGAATSAKLARGNADRTKDFPRAEFQVVALIAAQRPALEPRNDFGQGITV